MKPVSFILLVLLTALFAWYLVADRLTPITSQARVRAYVVPIVPQVSGYVSEVLVDDNSLVEPGQKMLTIDQRPYELALETAQANLDLAGQSVGANTAAVDSAQARVNEARSNYGNYKVQSERVFALEKKGLVPIAKADDARAKLSQAKAQVQTAQAELEKAKETMGAGGQENPEIRSAIAALAQARLDLSWTVLQSPTKGYVTNLQIDQGNYAHAGTPIMTFVSLEEIWIEAFYKENNLAHIDPGDPVELAFDAAPGKVFSGTVLSLGVGASGAKQSEVGELSEVESPKGWLRNPQRFPVLILIKDYNGSIGLRVNSQADIVVYTGDNSIMNNLGRIWIRLISWLSYAY
jgi:multidrug resistance efflux pump